ncbi:Uncharacterized protein ALO93_05438 [Pseudomonas amygdali pv. sesami]|nr:Uncharacterized protein ALO93_05438 [Pseudomonas amygdali pv. sesami]
MLFSADGNDAVCNNKNNNGAVENAPLMKAFAAKNNQPFT